MAALAIAQGCGLGLLNAYGLIVEPLAREFDAATATIGAGMSIFVLSMAFTSALLGPILDRGWVRPTMVAGIVTMAVGMAWLARAPSLGQLALALALSSIGIAAYGPVPCNVVLVNWFEEKRGTALAIAAAGPPLVGFVVPSATAFLIERGGWRHALATLSVVLAAVALPVVLRFVVARPEDVGETVDGRSSTGPAARAGPAVAGAAELLRSPVFWRLALGFGIYLAVPVGVGLFIVPLLLELGFSSWAAALGATLAAASNLTGTLCAGALADRFRVAPVLAGVLLLFFLALVTMGTVASPTVVFASIVPLAVGFGGGQPLLPLLVSERFGAAVVGRALGTIGAIGLPFLVASAPAAGWLRDAAGTYRAVFLGAAGAIAVAAALIAIRRPGRDPRSP